jgi:hypothetical protein
MRKISRLLAALFALALLPGLAAPAAGAGIVVSLRVEGMDSPLYYNGALTLAAATDATMRDVVDTYNSLPDVPEMETAVVGEDSVITAVGSLREKSLGLLFADGWMIRINGENAGRGLRARHVKAGDDIVIYYGDSTLIQYPEIDLTRMLSDGIVRFFSADAADGAGTSTVTDNPIVGAKVVWDGMTYLTNTSGEIIIDSTGAGVRHTVSIGRYYANGLPTVLRFAPGYYVRYEFRDVSADDWFYEAVMFASDRRFLTGVTETDFRPDAPMTRAMFVTVLGRLAETNADQTADTGFTDVTYDGVTTGYIVWAVQNGIAGGRPDGTFGPYERITREQLVVMLRRFADWEGFDTAAPGTDISVYSDNGAVAAYAQPAMAWAVAAGILTGTSGRLNPQGVCSRAQAAAILQRFITEYKV